MLHSSTARFSHRPYHFAMSVYFSTICHMTSRKLRLPQYIMGDDLHIWSYLVQNERGERNTCSFRSPWVTLPLNLFFPTHFVLFPSALIWAVDGIVCPAEYALYHDDVCCCLRMQIIRHAALSSSHHAMHCCHSVSIARSRLIAMKRGNVPTQSWSGKSAVFLMESALTSNGSSKSNKKQSDCRGISDYLYIYYYTALSPFLLFEGFI